MPLLGFYSYQKPVIFIAKIEPTARAVMVKAVSVTFCSLVMQLPAFSPACLNSTAIVVVTVIIYAKLSP